MSEKTTIPFPTFDGKRKHFTVFQSLFESYVAIKGFKDALHYTSLPSTEEECKKASMRIKADPKNATDKDTEMKRKWVSNQYALSYLLTAYKDDAMVAYIEESKNADWPNGRAYKVWTTLSDEYQPQDHMTVIDITRMKNKIKLKKDQNPKKLFEQLTKVQNRARASGQALSDGDMLTTVIEKSPKSVYAETISSIYREKKNRPHWKDIKKAMCDHWRTLHGDDDDSDEDDSEDEELGLFSSTKFQGRCKICKKKGHKAKDCWHKKGNETGATSFGKGRFNGTCHHCGKKGHKKAQCWELESNKHLRPEGWKSSKSKFESGAASENGGDKGDKEDTEFLLASINSGTKLDDSETLYQLSHVDLEELDLMGGHDDDSSMPALDDRGYDSDSSGDISWQGYDEYKDENESISDNEDENNEEKEKETEDETNIPEEIICNEEVHEVREADDDETSYGVIEALEEYLYEDETVNEIEKEVGELDICNPSEYILAGTMKFPAVHQILRDPNVFIGDTGATTDSTPHKTGMTNIKKHGSGKITMGEGNGTSISHTGDIKGTLCNKNADPIQQVTLKDVYLVPKANFNLFSITKRLKEGWKLFASKTIMWIEKDGTRINFDIIIPTNRGALYCLYLHRSDTSREVGATSVLKMSVTKAHELLGHPDENRTRKAAKALGWTLTRGTLKPCRACAIAKAKQRNVPKESDHVVSKESNGRIFLDISSIKKPKDIDIVPTKRHWRIIVDERTGLKVTDFFETKNGMVEPTCTTLNKWKEAKMPVKFIRCNNAGENKALEKAANGASWKLNIEFEYTGRATPQRNHLAELGFSILTKKGIALMVRANVPYVTRYRVYREAMKTATLLDGLQVIELDGKIATRYEHWNGKLPAFAQHLRTWGEAGTVKIKSGTTPKLADKGVQCMFVGYALGHGGDVYRMWNPKTNRIHSSRDVIWMRQMYYKASTIEEDENLETSGIENDESETAKTQAEDNDNENDKDSEESENEESNSDSDSESDKSDESRNTPKKQVRFSDTNDEIEPNAEPRTTRSGRVSMPPQRLIEELAAAAGIIEERAEAKDVGKIILSRAEQGYYKIEERLQDYSEVLDKATKSEFAEGEIAVVGAGIGGGFQNTNELKVMKYQQAMATDDRDEWDNAVDEEHERMVKHKTWVAVPIEDVPEDAKVIDSTWAMKKKSNGTFRARINARGFQQTEGQHYDASSLAAPVTNDATIRIAFVLMLMVATWTAYIVDVKGAFLHGEFENGETIYMKVPEGFAKFYPKNVLLLLLKTLYGLKQAAMAFWRKLLFAMERMKFKRSQADPCLYYTWGKYGLVIWLSWIDDCLCIGNKDAVQEAKLKMTKEFDCDDIGFPTEYVGCKLNFNEELNSLTFTQPVMLQSFNDEYEIDMNNSTPVTPMEPGRVLVSGAEEDQISPEQQTYYRSGTGKLIHMMRWSRPEIQNSVRELTRHLKGAVEGHVKAMHRIMLYAAKTPNRGWTLKPTRIWDGEDRDFEFIISGRSDSNYAACPDTRRSVSGWRVYLEDCPIMVKSVMQKIVALSVTEAELFSGVQCVQDMMFALRIMNSMGLKVKLPMILDMDNKGAVDIANNWSVGGRTRHVDTRQYFLRQLKEDGYLKINWISGSENESDLFTKNVPGPLFRKHTKAFCGNDEYS